MAATNVQAFSGDVKVANTLTVSNDIVVDDGVYHPLTIDASSSMIYNKQLYFGDIAIDSYNYLGRFSIYAPPAIFNILDAGSALGSGSRYSMSKGYGSTQPPIMNALEGSEFSTYNFYWEPEAGGGGDEEHAFYHVWFSPSRAGNYIFYIHAKDYLFPTEPSSPTYNDVIYGMLNLLGSNGTRSHVVVGRPNMSGDATLQLHNESQTTGDRLTHEAIQLFSNTTPTTGDVSNVFITMTPSTNNGGYGGYIEGWIKGGTNSGLSLGNISQGTKYRGLTITSQGSVGIGVTDPNTALSVAGDVNITGSKIRVENEIRYMSAWSSNNNQEFQIPFKSVGSRRPMYVEVSVTQVAANGSGNLTSSVRGKIPSLSSSSRLLQVINGINLSRFEVKTLGGGVNDAVSIKYRPDPGFEQNVTAVIDIRILAQSSPDLFGTLTRTDLGSNTSLASPTIDTAGAFDVAGTLRALTNFHVGSGCRMNSINCKMLSSTTNGNYRTVATIPGGAYRIFIRAVKVGDNTYGGKLFDMILNKGRFGISDISSYDIHQYSRSDSTYGTWPVIQHQFSTNGYVTNGFLRLNLYNAYAATNGVQFSVTVTLVGDAQGDLVKNFTDEF